jgi:small-conductance mechanosensitive channel
MNVQMPDVSLLKPYVAAAALVGAALVCLGVLKGIILRRLERLAQRTPSDLDDFLVSLLGRHLDPLFSLLMALAIGAQALTLPEALRRLAFPGFIILVTVKVLLVLQDVLVFAIRRSLLNDQRESPMSAAMLKHIAAILRIALWGAGALFILDNVGVNITAFVAGLGIGGVAVALAAQAILGDAFSSFAIFMDRPFEVGDFIVVGDVMGTVEHIGFKTTRLRSLGGEQVVCANSDLTNSRIRNFKRMQERRVEFTLGVVYQTPPEQVRAIPELLKAIIQEQPLTRFDRAHFHSFGESALIFEVAYYLKSPDYNEHMDVQQEIGLRIMERFRQEGIVFAYPTRQLYVTNTT